MQSSHTSLFEKWFSSGYDKQENDVNLNFGKYLTVYPAETKCFMEWSNEMALFGKQIAIVHQTSTC